MTTKQLEQKTDRNVNTELSAVVIHIAKLNDSGVDKETTDRETRVVEIAKQKWTIPSESEFRRQPQIFHRA